jgi:hypothetical protein
VLNQHRDVLGDSCALVSARLAEHGVVDFDLICAIRELSRQLVSHPAKLLLEDLTTHFLTHRHATRSFVCPLPRLASIVACCTGCGEGRCPKFT